MKVLVLCEYSGIVSQAFRAKGHDVTSCDIIPSLSSGNHHIGDALEFARSQTADLIIAHPPCTFLCKAQFGLAARQVGRYFNQIKAAQFVRQIYSLDCPRICVENPVGWLNKNWLYPAQIIYPYNFGDPYRKDVCLWLKGLPPLISTCVNPVRKSMSNHVNGRMSQAQKSKIKSRFFIGVADAMAQQWS